MKCYLKPDIYERLAMEYVIGTLQGKARTRFEKLQQQYPYIQASVDEVAGKLTHLTERLPTVEPPRHVWQNVQRAIDATSVDGVPATGTATGNWFDFLTGARLALASVFALLLGLVVFIGIQPKQAAEADPMGFVSTLMDTANKPMAEVVAMKSDMKMRVKLNQRVAVPDGRVLAVWCIPKDTTQPAMNMGILPESGSMEMDLTQALWQGLMEANEFVVSFEPKNISNQSPSTNIKFKGRIVALTKV